MSGDGIIDATDDDDDEGQGLVDKMKSLVIDENNLDVVKANLRVTREYRRKMLLNKRTDLLESYAIFFTHVSLVCTVQS